MTSELQGEAFAEALGAWGVKILRAIGDGAIANIDDLEVTIEMAMLEFAPEVVVTVNAEDPEIEALAIVELVGNLYRAFCERGANGGGR